ncbi:MAG: glycosyltransferase family 4 protein [Pedococcus sp.]
MLSAPLSVLLLNWRDLNHPEGGGSEKYLAEVAKGLAARGHRVTFRTAAYPGALPRETVDGVRYLRRGGRYSVYLRAIAAQAVGRHRADVVVDVQNGVPFLTPLVRSGTPVINLVHHVHREQWPVVFGPAVARLGWWLESRVAPAVYRRSRYVAVSTSTKSELGELGVEGDRVSVIHNGTDAVADEHVRRHEHPVVMVLGRLVPQKRVDIAMHAVRDLARTHPELELWVVGSGYWDSELHRVAAELGITDRVTFTGHVSEAEKHRLLAQAWVLALPSLKEGWGLVVVEAGVHGTPTVAFADAGGLNESVHDGETGLLVHGGQAEFTAALGGLLDDPQRRQQMSGRVVEWVTKFRWPETVSLWEKQLYAAAGHSLHPSENNRTDH